MTPFRVGLVFAVICGVAFWQSIGISQSAIQMTVGPAAVPKAVLALLTLMTIFYLVSAWQGHQVDESHSPDQEPLKGSGFRLFVLFAGGGLFIAGVSWLGFVLPATACGMCVARSFDAPFNAKSGLICLLFSSGIWFLFAKLLGVGLGPATPFGF